MSKETYNAYENAQRQFDQVAEKIRDEVTRCFVNPCEYHFPCPSVWMMEVLKYLEVIGYSTTMPGACKRGIRFHPAETADTIRALSMDDWKCSVVDIPLGGGKRYNLRPAI